MHLQDFTIYCLITNTFQIECFDERVLSEKQAYINLRREAKGVTDLTLRLSYQHGRPLDITPDKNILYRNFQPVYQ